jgi:HSP20 family protein
MFTRFSDFGRTLSTFDLLAREMDRAFGEGGQPLFATRVAQWPHLNVYEDAAGFVVRAEVPGVAEGDVELLVEDDVLTLRGARKVDAPAGYEVRLRERAAASFARKIALGVRIDAAAVGATLKDGILTVTLPKAKEAMPRQIAVRASS